jgi:hypothetical protein
VTRKHFEAIARILNSGVADDPVAENLRIAAALATYLAETNPRFDIERFMDASGFESGTYKVTGGFGPREVRPA